MADQNVWQDLSTVQSGLQPSPGAIASAASIAPKTFLSLISGTTAIATVSPPMDGVHMLAFIFTTTTPVAFTTTGNIKYVATPTQNIPMLLIYEPIAGKYHPGELTT